MSPVNRRNAVLRTPTLAEFHAFDGAHCRTLYQSLPEDWRCPGCKRTRYQILRWTVRFRNLSSRLEGWAGGYARHHDHSVDDIRYGRTPPDGRIARFAETIVCEQCNSADGTVKRKLGLPAHFSFAPVEIRQFVTPTPHGFHTIDYEIARMLYEQFLEMRYF